MLQFSIFKFYGKIGNREISNFVIFRKLENSKIENFQFFRKIRKLENLKFLRYCNALKFYKNGQIFQFSNLISNFKIFLLEN